MRIRNKDGGFFSNAIYFIIGIPIVLYFSFQILIMCRVYNVFEKKVGKAYEINGVDYIDYNGATYTRVDDFDSYGYKRIPKSLGGAGMYSIHNIEFDKNQDYIIATALRESYIYSKYEDIIPCSGEVTGIYIGNDNEIFMTDKEKIKQIISLTEINGEKYSYDRDEKSISKTSLEFCYNGSLIAPFSFKEIVHLVNGNWVYTNEFNTETSIKYGYLIKDPEQIDFLESFAEEVEAEGGNNCD